MKQQSVSNFSAKQLRKAAKIKDKIEALQTELARLIGDGALGEADAPVKKRRKRRMSAAGRAKIAAAAKARWAKVRAAKK